MLRILAAVFIMSPGVYIAARAGGHGGGHSHSASHYTSPATTHSSTYAVGVKRDSSGAIARSSTARSEFLKASGYPNGRSGYVVDHIIPLKRGGSDTPSNMQWQTIAEAKAKDKTE